jgi:hypothetical protein
MHLTEEQLNVIEEMAYRLFKPFTIAINIEVDEIEFQNELTYEGSDVRNAFYKGLIRQETELRNAIIKASNNGSNPAQEQLLRMMKNLNAAL